MVALEGMVPAFHEATVTHSWWVLCKISGVTHAWESRGGAWRRDMNPKERSYKAGRIEVRR